MLIQTLSAKLGIASGFNLAEQCRNHFSRPVVLMMWALMELVAMATDLAEFLGAALGFNLLLGIPLWLAGILTAIVTFLILGLENRGFRPLEAVITALIGVVAVSYVIETVLDKPQWGDAFFHAIVPQFSGAERVLLATGILGATVIPHAIFLHSALTQHRIVTKDADQTQRLFRFEVCRLRRIKKPGWFIAGRLGLTHCDSYKQGIFSMKKQDIGITTFFRSSS